MASDALKNLMSFSTIRFEERQCQGVPRGNAWARFLGSFFAARQRMNIQNRHSSARACAQYERPKEKL
jgi:hypothetical protein